MIATPDPTALTRKRRRLAAALLAAMAAACGAPALRASEPLEPSAALADFRVPAGYRIELVAAEPEVVDPIAMAFDAGGRLWVVEMRDYPLLAEGAAPTSRIRILVDRNRDGRFESGHTFADGLLFPTGLQLWGSGAFVTLAGEIAYFPDDDHDGRADSKETWYEGFATLNEQLRANHPTLGADGWIYVAGGLRGGQIKNHRRPQDAPLSINGRDFAFEPRSGQCRAVSGDGQFGLAFDEFGRRFTCSNRNPLMAVMIEQHYLQQNPALVLPRIVHDVAAAGVDSRLYARSRALTTSAQHTGQFTAACGIELSSGDGPPGAQKFAFICEPTANLVHREGIECTGAAMTAQRVDEHDEFLTATDEWFRPVNLHTGPDGALYVVDMYRAIIEHPEWMPEELRNRPDMRLGADRGRIYRIVAENAAGQAADKPAAAKAPGEPVSRLECANSWERDLAVRQILESAEPPIDSLREIAAESGSPPARYLALALLESLGALPTELLLKALADSAAGVREQALCIAERRLSEPAVAEALLRCADDPDARVRYQAVLSSMFLPAEQAFPALLDVAQRDNTDPWSCRAAALAARDQAARLLIALLPSAEPGGESASADLAPGLVRELIAAVVATGGAEETALVLETLPTTTAHTARTVLVEAAAALESRSTSLGQALALVERRNPAAHAAIVRLFDEALARAMNPQQAEAERIAAARLLRIDARPENAPQLLALVREGSSPALQLAALEALRLQSGDEASQALLEMLPQQLPSVRRATVDLLVSKAAWASELLAAAAADPGIADEIGPAARMQLLQHADPGVLRLARQVFGAASDDRQAVVTQYRHALELAGDADSGRQLFLTVCSTCHRVGEQGVAVGPDIGDSSMKPAAQLLTDILDPNRAIDANYVNYTALTIDGLAHQGLIRSETDGGIVLVGANNETITVLRDELESLTSGKSLMPEGLEQQLSPQQMADLLRYLRTWRHAEDVRGAGGGNAGQTPDR